MSPPRALCPRRRSQTGSWREIASGIGIAENAATRCGLLAKRRSRLAGAAKPASESTQASYCLERQIIMLLPRVLQPLVPQLPQPQRDPLARRMRVDHLVDIPA